MTAEDQSEYDRFKKLLDRLGKPIVMSAEAETSEIIRRRLFEWNLRAVSPDGRVLLSKDSEEARKLLAWEDIDAEESDRLDEIQRRQLAESLKKARRDLREAVWRSYKNIALLGKDNAI